MRNLKILLALLALITISGAQDDPGTKEGDAPPNAGEKADPAGKEGAAGGGEGKDSAKDGAKDGEKDGEKDGAKEAPKAPPVWKMPAKELGKLEKLLADYLNPGKKTRGVFLAKIEKLLGKKIDGHSALEDVHGIVGIANRHRPTNKRLKKGRVQEISIQPDVHGFPGGIGTVRYHVYLPKGYTGKQVWPLLFCMPHNRTWPEGADYIKTAWLERSDDIKEKFIIAVPVPQSKGDVWTKSKSWARAMIALRHLVGSYGADAKTAGPSVDALRVYVAGGDAAALAAARYSEMFAGAVLSNADGRATPGPNLREGGGLHGVPAYFIYQAKNRNQKNFATDLASSDDACVAVEAKDKNAMGDGKAIGEWLLKTGPKNPQPAAIEYTVYDGSFQRHHWINVLEFDATAKPQASFSATADRAKNEVRIEVNGVNRFEIFLSDALVDLNRSLSVVVVEGDKSYPFFTTKDGTETVTRNLGRALAELVASNHPGRVYTNFLIVDVPTLREAARVRDEAAKDAAKDKNKGATVAPLRAHPVGQK